MTLSLVPITLKAAHVWIREHHSHLDRSNGGLFAVAVELSEVCMCEHTKSQHTATAGPHVDACRECGPFDCHSFDLKAPRLCCVGLVAIPNSRIVMESSHACEITRVASDRTPHAASMTIAALARASLALGYRRIVSSTLLGEPGTCYRAAGWWPTALGRGGDWGRPSRERLAAAQPGEKVRWEFGPDAVKLEALEEAALYALIDEAVGRVEFQPRREAPMPLFDGGVS